MTAVLSHETATNPAIPSAEVTAARTVTLRAAPRREPPFDDEAPHLRSVHESEQPLPFEPWPGRLSLVRPWSAPRPTSRGELPDPAIWARRLLIAVLEARAGRRPLHQLASYLGPGVHAALVAELERGPQSTAAISSGTANPRTPPTVKSIRVCEPADGVAEVSAVISAGPRYRAIAARLEGLDGRWRCVRLQIG